MKKLILFSLLFTLFGCNFSLIEVGKFRDEREALHEKRNYDVCDDNPDRCVQDTNVPW